MSKLSYERFRKNVEIRFFKLPLLAHSHLVHSICYIYKYLKTRYFYIYGWPSGQRVVPLTSEKAKPGPVCA